MGVNGIMWVSGQKVVAATIPLTQLETQMAANTFRSESAAVRNTVTNATETQAAKANNGNSGTVVAAENKMANSVPSQRPTPIESEISLTPKASMVEFNQMNFKSGHVVNSRVQGSVKPESYNILTMLSTEVKNFTFKPDGASVKSMDNLVKQIIQRKTHLPAGSTQKVIVDVRGQNVPLMQQMHFKNYVLTKARTPNVDIIFQTQ